jgi:hypothetical protein
VPGKKSMPPRARLRSTTRESNRRWRVGASITVLSSVRKLVTSSDAEVRGVKAAARASSPLTCTSSSRARRIRTS